MTVKLLVQTCFLLIAVLCQHSIIESSIIKISTSQNETTKYNEYVRNKVISFKLKLHEITETKRLTRQRRDNYQALQLHNIQDNIQDDFSLPFNSFDSKFIILGEKDGTIQFLHKKTNYVKLASFKSRHSILKLLAFFVGSQLWLVVHYRRSNQQEFLQVHSYKNLSLNPEQRIEFKGNALIEGVFSKNSFCLGILELNLGFKSKFSLYEWKGTQFDKIIQSEWKVVQTFTMWNTNGVLYIDISLKPNVSHILEYVKGQFEDKFHFLQFIESDSPSLVRHFVIGDSSYLVFVNGNIANIYWWTGSQFLLWQKLDIYLNGTVVDAAVLKRRNDVLIFMSYSDIEYFVQDTTSHFVRMKLPNLLDPESFNTIVNWQHLCSYPMLSRFLSLFRDPEFDLLSFPVSNPLVSCLHNVKLLLNDTQEILDDFYSKRDKVWMKNTTTHLEANVTVIGHITSNFSSSFREIIITAPNDSTNLLTSQQFDEEMNVGFYHLSHIDFSICVRKSLNQTIQGTTHFTKPIYFTHGSFNIIDTIDPNINDIKVSKLLHALQKSGNQVATSNFEISDLYTNAAYLHGSLNGLQIEDFLLLEGSQYVMGDLSFWNIDAVNLDVDSNGLINNIKFDDIVLASRNMDIVHKKKFATLMTANLNSRDALNVSSINEKVVYIDSFDKPLKSKLSFLGDIIINGNLETASEIADLYFELQTSAVKKIFNRTIYGAKVFVDEVFVDDIILQGKLNNILLQSIVTLTGQQDITGFLTFSDLTFHDHLVLDSLNNLNFNEDIVSLQNYVVYDRKMFTNNLKVNGDIIIDGISYINDIDVSNLTLLIPNIKTAIIADDIYLKGIVARNINVTSSSNIPLLKLKDEVWMRSINQEILQPVYFNSIEVNNMNVRWINYLQFNSSFIPTYGDYHVENQMNFQDSVFVNSLNFEPGVYFNNYALHSLNILTPSQNYVTNITGQISMDNMIVKGSINGITSLNDIDFKGNLMFVSGFQVSSGKHFQTVYSNSLAAQNMDITLLNGDNFKDFIQNTVMKVYPRQIPVSMKKFEYIIGNELISFGNVSGYYLEDVFSRIVTLDTSQINIVGKIFRFPPTISNFGSTRRLFGFSLSDIPSRVVFVNETDEIYGHKRFSRATASSIKTQLVNEVNLEALNNKAMRKLAPYNFMMEHVTFGGTIDCSDGLIISVNRTADGIDLENTVKIYEKEYFSVLFFENNIIVRGDVNVEGLINNCNVINAFENALYLNGPLQVFQNETTFANLEIKRNLTIYCSVNDILIRHLNKIVTLNNDRNLLQNVYFGNDVQVRQLIIYNVVNNVNVTHLISDALTTDEFQVIQGKKSFPNFHVTILSMKTANISFLNDVDIKELLTSTIDKYSRQIINTSVIADSFYARNVHITGKLNGIKVWEDVVLVNTSEVITSETIFNTSMIVTKDLAVSGRIDDVFLDDISNDYIFLNKEDTIYSDIAFLNDVTITGEMKVNRINDIEVMDFSLRNHTKEEYKGKKLFMDIQIIGNLDVQNYVNGIDIFQLDDSILRYDDDEYVNSMDFSRSINTTFLNVTGGVNNISINALWINAHDAVEHAENVSNEINSRLYEIEESLPFTRKAVSIFAYFELYQWLHLPAPKNEQFYMEAEERESKSIITWVSNCFLLPMCCHEIKSVQLIITPNKTLVQEAVYQGKFFFYVLKSRRSGIQEFTFKNEIRQKIDECDVWFNTMVETSFESRTYGNDLSNGEYEVRDAIFIETKDELYLAVLYFASVPKDMLTLYRYDWGRLLFKIQRQWANAVSIDVAGLEKPFDQRDNIHLAIGFNDTKVPLAIFQWNSFDKKFFEVESITVTHPSSTVFWVSNGHDKLLLVANEKNSIRKDNTVVDVYTDPIQVYKLGANLDFYETIDIGGVCSFESFHLSGETYVLAVSRHRQAVFIIQWKGYSRFQLIQEIPSPGVWKVKPYFAGDNELMLAIFSVNNQVKVLKGVIRKMAAMTESTFL